MYTNIYICIYTHMYTVFIHTFFSPCLLHNVQPPIQNQPPPCHSAQLLLLQVVELSFHDLSKANFVQAGSIDAMLFNH